MRVATRRESIDTVRRMGGCTAAALLLVLPAVLTQAERPTIMSTAERHVATAKELTAVLSDPAGRR